MLNKNISGFKNEFEFHDQLNNRKVSELNILFRDFIDDLFDNPNENSTIYCYVDSNKKKYDIVITINNVIRRISIKKGIKNSVHVESISSFIHFLIENKIPRDIVIEYLKYQYADGTTNGTEINRLSAAEYKQLNQDKIDNINNSLNNIDILTNAIDRFLLKGNISSYEIDAIVYGTIDDFIWIKKNDIKNLILSKADCYSSSPHFGPLTIQPLDRCLNRNVKYNKKRYCVQLKWYNIFDDIIEYQNNVLIAENQAVYGNFKQ